MDEGFRLAGFSTVWANEIDSAAANTFEANHAVKVDRRSIAVVVGSDIPDVEGFVGGPPCQSWSAAGAKRGENDPRGELFFEYVRLIGEVRPKFFVAENVQGLLSERNSSALNRILDSLRQLGYNVSIGLLNAENFQVPQARKRVFIVGIRTDLAATFLPPEPSTHLKNLVDALKGIPFNDAARVSTSRVESPELLPIPNNHYWAGEHFSYIYMSRNRRRRLDERSFTIQASAAHAPLHPNSAPMKQVSRDVFEFDLIDGRSPRRLSVRECARIQTFPDNYVFKYKSINDGYKQVGNAVPVKLAEAIGEIIREIVESNPVPSISDRFIEPGLITKY